jgi:hypothetical protein
LVTFNIVHGGSFTRGLNREDIILLEDGKPRAFTTFEGADTQGRVPLDLILLFDTTTLPASTKQRPVLSHWDRTFTYGFMSDWDDVLSGKLLEHGGADVRLSIAHVDGDRLENLRSFTRNPRDLTASFRRISDPISSGSGETLTAPRGYEVMHSDQVILGSFGMLHEAVLASLSEAQKAGPSIRMLAVFSEGFSGTTTPTQDVADAASAVGMHLYPIVLDYQLYNQKAPPNKSNNAGTSPIYLPGPSSAGQDSYAGGLVPAMVRFSNLAEMTGGRSFFPAHLDASAIQDIVNAMASEGSSQYYVAFVPDPATRRREHKLEIRLKNKAIGKVVGGQRRSLY